MPRRDVNSVYTTASYWGHSFQFLAKTERYTLIHRFKNRVLVPYVRIDLESAMNIIEVTADLNQLRLRFLEAANGTDLSVDVIQSLESTTEDFYRSILILNEHWSYLKVLPRSVT